ncbi:MAG: branched-chain amino acid ABC transporter permease [Anaeromyxobacter sp.]|nr:branched-chain amino acid ABC transporter permease [Anaeromyxobacter sp.]MBL0278273.1 branched-chain amino acid ABC transporter permease [Anaeromyxobacter sp.]
MRSRYAQLGLFALVVVAVQLATALGGKPFYLTQLTMTAYAGLVVIGLCLFMGYAGQISLGHAGFFAIGGYTSAFLTTFDLTAGRGAGLTAWAGRWHLLVQRPDLYGGELLTVRPWPAALAAVALAVLVAALVGVPVLRLKGHYLAMATLGFGTIVSSVVVGTERLGAADGLSGVPAFELGLGLAVTGGAAARVQNYYLAWGLVALGMWLLLNLVASRVGRALRAIHGAEDAAGAMGIDVADFKLRTFVLSAAFAALAGVLLTHYTGGIGPSEAAVMKSVRYVAIVAVGGMGSLWGTLLVGSALQFLSLRGLFGSFDDAVFGVILIAVMLFAPDGLLRVDLAGAARALLRRPGAPAAEG